ncbi:Uma2 family endonuclease, partial [Streptomyces flaveolus]|uniref:Uma2 family endonuclease n=1 Tax=Streptomyces flaveolus TaxID=67297 RepID=UPI003318B6C8
MTERSVYRHLREFRETLHRPESIGWPEISHGQLLMMTSPKKQHQLVAHRLRTQLEPQLGDDLVLMLETDMEDANLGILRVPDLVVIDEEEATAAGDSINPLRSHLVIEIVSRSRACFISSTQPADVGGVISQYSRPHGNTNTAGDRVGRDVVGRPLRR